MSKRYERGLALILMLWLACCFKANAQVAVTPAPVPKLQFLDVNGKPLAGGRVCTFAASTTTPLTTYSESTGSSANTNPITLDSGGFANIFLTSAAYKFIVYSSVGADSNCPNAGVSQYSVDGINPGALGNTAITGTLSASGAVTLSSTLAVTGATTLSSTLSVAGTSALHGVTGATLTGAANGNSVTLLCKAGGQAAQTGTAAEVVLTNFSCTIPANTIQAGKGFRVYFAVEHTSGAANVVYKMRMAGATAFSFSWTDGASVVKSGGYITILNNAGVQNAQTTSSFVFIAGAMAAPTGATGSFDFTQAQTLDFTFNVANTDTVTPRMFTVELLQ